MIQLVEIHTFKGGQFFLFHVPLKEARHKQKELWADGYLVTYTKNI